MCHGAAYQHNIPMGMNKNLLTVITAILIAGFLLTNPGYAQGKTKHHETMPEFTAEQEKQITDLKMKLMKETEPVKTELKIKQMELQILWKEDNPDAKKVLAKAKEISALKASLQEKMVNHKLSILKILSPEQKKIMKEKMGMHGMDCCGMDDCGMGGCGMHGMGKGAGSGCHGARSLILFEKVKEKRAGFLIPPSLFPNLMTN